jgi:hypothetical protein
MRLAHIDVCWWKSGPKLHFDTTTPRNVSLSSEGGTAEGPFGDEQNTLP